MITHYRHNEKIPPLGKKLNLEIFTMTMTVLVTRHVWYFVTPWTVAHEVPLSMEYSRQEYWSGLPFPSQGGLPYPGIKPGSPAMQADSLPSEPAEFKSKNLLMNEILKIPVGMLPWWSSG